MYSWLIHFFLRYFFAYLALLLPAVVFVAGLEEVLAFELLWVGWLWSSSRSLWAIFSSQASETFG